MHNLKMIFKQQNIHIQWTVSVILFSISSVTVGWVRVTHTKLVIADDYVYYNFTLCKHTLSNDRQTAIIPLPRNTENNYGIPQRCGGIGVRGCYRHTAPGTRQSRHPMTARGRHCNPKPYWSEVADKKTLIHVLTVEAVSDSERRQYTETAPAADPTLCYYSAGRREGVAIMSTWVVIADPLDRARLGRSFRAVRATLSATRNWGCDVIDVDSIRNTPSATA